MMRTSFFWPLMLLAMFAYLTSLHINPAEAKVPRKQVKINVQPDTVYIWDPLEGSKGQARDKIWIQPDRSVTLYFLKDEKNRKNEINADMRQGYMKNDCTIEAPYFMHHDTYPEGGKIIFLQEWSAKERLLGFIKRNKAWVSIGFIIFAALAFPFFIRIANHLKEHRVLKERKKFELAVPEDGSPIVAEIGDIRGLDLPADLNSQAYVLKKFIGQGAMGAVYMAWEILRKHRSNTALVPYAVKVLFPSIAKQPDSLERFKREKDILVKLTHPNIVQVYNWGCKEHEKKNETLKIHFIVMEYLRGEPLSKIICEGECKDGKPLDFSPAIRLTLEILDALSFAHNNGIIHRDIKPSNIFITEEGHVKILDFGISKMLNAKTLTREDVAIGTPLYLPPEQLDSRNVDERADLYSVGVILYQMLTGKPPFWDDNIVMLIGKHHNEEPKKPSELNPAIPRALEEIVLKLLMKKPEERYDGAKEAAVALRQTARVAGIDTDTGNKAQSQRSGKT